MKTVNEFRPCGCYPAARFMAAAKQEGQALDNPDNGIVGAGPDGPTHRQCYGSWHAMTVLLNDVSAEALQKPWIRSPVNLIAGRPGKGFRYSRP